MRQHLVNAMGAGVVLALAGGLMWMGLQRNVAVAQAQAAAPTPVTALSRAAPPAVSTVAGMPPVPDVSNLYSETAAGKLSPALAGDLARIYVPNLRGNDVHVVDPAAMKVVDRFRVGHSPQHVVPSWDLRTLWVLSLIHI